ncbi:baseplate tail tube cap [Acinetobacter phage Acj9]|uniref:Gp48 baseplate tail tube cap n=1 Tax=Acinetobacter phage Acj9 TaxID=760939 RepID=E5EPY6_9CAUD|nr:baseplate tail tube cap [Acinetobacter phage Acj9]ADG60102.1 gp48 baseplate tail tube cap [Acinetobacter phage Acj9]
MQIEEITDLVSKAGSDISAGQSMRSQESETKILTAQYPAERSASVANTADVGVGQSYSNGLLFTAFEYKSRTTNDLRSMRTKAQNAAKVLRSSKSVTKAIQAVTGGNPNDPNTIKNPVANILMPRSKTDTDVTGHKFNDVGESLISRGGGTATGILSNVASTAVFGTIESVTKGAMADHGEQIYNTSRSMYAGAENRVKTYTWELTPRTYDDLTQIVKIYEIFNYLSYGMTGKSAFAKGVKDEIDKWYRKTFINPLNEATGSNVQSTTMESVTSFLSNVIVVSNPTVWTIQNFGTASKFDGLADVFGPAQISNIRFDKAPDGQFNGLAAAPNMPSSFVLEVTFREILTLNRATIYGESPL